jgi:hypothetical protein
VGHPPQARKSSNANSTPSHHTALTDILPSTVDIKPHSANRHHHPPRSNPHLLRLVTLIPFSRLTVRRRFLVAHPVVYNDITFHSPPLSANLREFTHSEQNLKLGLYNYSYFGHNTSPCVVCVRTHCMEWNYGIRGECVSGFCGIATESCVNF